MKINMKKIISSEKLPNLIKLKRKCNTCGIFIDDRSKNNLCKKHNKTGKLNGFFGKKHSKETRNKMKIFAKKRDNSTYYKIPATKEIIEKREATKKERWNNFSIEEKHKKLENFIKAGRRKKGTKIEIIIQNVLNDIGMIKDVDYKTNVYIHSFNVDFLINNRFIVECYGDYWHKNPKQYNDLFSIKKREQDLKRKEFLENKGYKFINLWENDIHNNLSNIRNELGNFFGCYINLFQWETCV